MAVVVVDEAEVFVVVFAGVAEGVQPRCIACDVDEVTVGVVFVLRATSGRLPEEGCDVFLLVVRAVQAFRFFSVVPDVDVQDARGDGFGRVPQAGFNNLRGVFVGGDDFCDLNMVFINMAFLLN